VWVSSYGAARDAIAKSDPQKTKPLTRRGVVYLLGRSTWLRRNLPRWPYETLAEHSQLGQVIAGELVIPIREVPHRLVEPVVLVGRVSADHAALDDLLKHLISSLIEHRRLCDGH
jgi:hypothetical protein